MVENFDFSGFDELLNEKALSDIETASQKTFSNEPLPENVYQMTIENLSLFVTKKGLPAVKCDLKVKEGNYKNRHEFYYLNLCKADGNLDGFKVYMAQKFLNSLTGDSIKCSVKDGFDNFDKEIQSVFEFAKNGYYDMKVSYNYGKNADGSKNESVRFLQLEPQNFYECE